VPRYVESFRAVLYMSAMCRCCLCRHLYGRRCVDSRCRGRRTSCLSMKHR